jgi:Arc/MetJ family transcription regulator
MATSVQIDPDLLEQAVKLSGEKTKKATVTRALREFIARRRQSQLLDLFGSLDWDPEYSRSERSRR